METVRTIVRPGTIHRHLGTYLHVIFFGTSGTSSPGLGRPLDTPPPASSDKPSFTPHRLRLLPGHRYFGHLTVAAVSTRGLTGETELNNMENVRTPRGLARPDGPHGGQMLAAIAMTLILTVGLTAEMLTGNTAAIAAGGVVLLVGLCILLGHGALAATAMERLPPLVRSRTTAPEGGQDDVPG